MQFGREFYSSTQKVDVADLSVILVWFFNGVISRRSHLLRLCSVDDS